MTTKSPRWHHDCPDCIFLGQTLGRSQIVDLYYHESAITGLNGTLIARYGNDGPEYYSTTYGYAHPEGHAELFAAQELWRSRGAFIPTAANPSISVRPLRGQK